jgi:hypothetical protein
MLFDAICEFVALSDQVGVKGSHHRVRELMAAFRRSGFSSPQISELSGAKWSDTLVRQYTRGWGGVDDSMSLQRESIMRSLRKLAASGRGVEDVDAVLRLDTSVKGKGSSLEEVAELNSNLGKLDLTRGEIGKLVTLSGDLGEQVLTPGAVQGWMTLDQELAEDGFNKPARVSMYKTCKKYGGVANTLRLLNEFDNLGEIMSESTRQEALVKSLELKIVKLIDEKEMLDMEIDERKMMINAVNKAIFAGFDDASLIMISVLAKDYGGPYKVVSAVQKYPSLKKMEEELEAKKAELERVKKETSEKHLYLNALNYSLMEAKQTYDANIDVRLLVELLVNPRDIKIDRTVVARLTQRVLHSAAQRLEETTTILTPPNPALDAAIENIKTLAERLQALTGTEAKGS